MSYYIHPFFPRIRGKIVKQKDEMIQIDASYRADGTHDPLKSEPKIYIDTTVPDHYYYRPHWSSDMIFSDWYTMRTSPRTYSIYYDSHRSAESAAVQKSTARRNAEYGTTNLSLNECIEHLRHIIRDRILPEKDIKVIRSDGRVWGFSTLESLAKKLEKIN